MMHTDYPNFNSILKSEPPDWLYHYTSPAGLIGISNAGALWATDVRFLNDSKEIGHAIDYAVNLIENRRGPGSLGTIHERSELYLLDEMISMAGSSGLSLFVTSLTEHADQLSQWRGYCPPEGGFAVGIKSDHLSVIAPVQGFYLCRCVYDHLTTSHIILEIVDWHIDNFRARLSNGQDEKKARVDVALNFGREIQRYGVILKHRSFYEEAEWRLVATPAPLNSSGILFRPGPGRVVPYKVFALDMEAHPIGHVKGIVGPTSDYAAAAWSMQSLLQTRFPKSEVSMGRAEVPYRTW